jgi:DEAD/DEAH box helicase domain-containing protein
VPAGIETVVLASEVRPARGRRVEVIEVKREGGGVRRVVVGGENGEGVEESGGEEVITIKEEPVDH